MLVISVLPLSNEKITKHAGNIQPIKINFCHCWLGLLPPNSILSIKDSKHLSTCLKLVIEDFLLFLYQILSPYRHGRCSLIGSVVLTFHILSRISPSDRFLGRDNSSIRGELVTFNVTSDMPRGLAENGQDIYP